MKDSNEAPELLALLLAARSGSLWDLRSLSGGGWPAMSATVQDQRQPRSGRIPLKLLIGSGDKILLFTSPFLLAGVPLNALFRSSFEVGGPPLGLGVPAAALLIAGATA
jgi:hypothetical protein